MPYTLPTTVAHAIGGRRPFRRPDLDLTGYRTRGGSYVVASCGQYSDDGKPHDLVLIQPPHPVAVGSWGVMLRPNVHPELLAAIAVAIAGEVDRDAPAATGEPDGLTWTPEQLAMLAALAVE